MAMNTVSGNASSVASLASSVFGNAREALKAIADAAANPESGADKAATNPPSGGKGVRRGTVLDRYL
ncbi:hypothetical protein Acy02nite_05890 [Actinoplanes cyaneus]|uniref:Uncharacterized protein n=1 Tax=Actinoplanes cyaneus TaxID=52696 RepID=A0A919M308_9ACTN|nr:hypothetical protein [Actinoplanes cyaneus]GID62708.1 hypothetical protein Acy02nite_05890 [Actinoplanes cyaneus]